MTGQFSRMRPTWPLILSIVGLLVGMAGVTSGGELEIVVPNAYANVEAPAWGGNAPSMRVQFLYAADQFGGLPRGGGYVTTLRFRPDGASTYSGPLFCDELTVSMSVTPPTRTPANMSLVFAENITPPVTIVWATAPWEGYTGSSGPAGGPKVFDIEFVLNTPYRYNPAEGNLLLELIILAPVWPIALDRAADTSDLAVVFAADADATIGEARGGGHVTQLTFVPIEPSLADFDLDDDVDRTDLEIFEACATGPGIVYHATDLPDGCTAPADDEGVIDADFDRDRDVDQADFAVFQRCYSGEGRWPDLNCTG